MVCHAKPIREIKVSFFLFQEKPTSKRPGGARLNTAPSLDPCGIHLFFSYTLIIKMARTRKLKRPGGATLNPVQSAMPFFTIPVSSLNEKTNAKIGGIITFQENYSPLNDIWPDEAAKTAAETSTSNLQELKYNNPQYYCTSRADFSDTFGSLTLTKKEADKVNTQTSLPVKKSAYALKHNLEPVEPINDNVCPGKDFPESHDQGLFAKLLYVLFHESCVRKMGAASYGQELRHDRFYYTYLSDLDVSVAFDNILFYFMATTPGFFCLERMYKVSSVFGASKTKYVLIAGSCYPLERCKTDIAKYGIDIRKFLFNSRVQVRLDTIIESSDALDARMSKFYEKNNASFQTPSPPLKKYLAHLRRFFPKDLDKIIKNGNKLTDAFWTIHGDAPCDGTTKLKIMDAIEGGNPNALDPILPPASDFVTDNEKIYKKFFEYDGSISSFDTSGLDYKRVCFMDLENLKKKEKFDIASDNLSFLIQYQKKTGLIARARDVFKQNITPGLSNIMPTIDKDSNAAKTIGLDKPLFHAIPDTFTGAYVKVKLGSNGIEFTVLNGDRVAMRPETSVDDWFPTELQLLFEQKLLPKNFTIFENPGSESAKNHFDEMRKYLTFTKESFSLLLQALRRATEGAPAQAARPAAAASAIQGGRRVFSSKRRR